MAHYAASARAEIRDTFAAFCAARPVGAKFAHRALRPPAGSSPSMKWVNPPVAFMLHAGVPLLLAAGVHLPGLHDGDAQRVALEAYPGPAGARADRPAQLQERRAAKQTPDRLIARKDLITALEQGRTRLGLRLKLTHAQRDALVEDASGDSLDAVLCLVQAAWARAAGRAALRLAGRAGSAGGLDRFRLRAASRCRVIPAKAGIQGFLEAPAKAGALDSRLRGNDGQGRRALSRPNASSASTSVRYSCSSGPGAQHAGAFAAPAPPAA